MLDHADGTVSARSHEQDHTVHDHAVHTYEGFIRPGRSRSFKRASSVICLVVCPFRVRV